MSFCSRIDKHNYYLNIAQSVAGRGTCLRRNYGAIIVKNDEIIATGYTGAPRGRKNCVELQRCRRMELNVKSGERYDLSRSVHAEANCIISAARRDMIGSVMYLVGLSMPDGSLYKDACCCEMCKRLIINSGIEKVIARNTEDKYTVFSVESWIENDDSLNY